ncbi:MAG TPA: HAD-IIIA family hydrolase [Opitutaceae bacterium]|jgi:D-glycero-D-manno-heptose 1,7-bisphosphate phosphatase
MGRPAVFLDRDGTLNAQVVRGGKPFAPTRVEDFRIMDGVPEACRRLKQAGFALVVATNQPDVGRGDVSQDVIEAMHRRLLEAVPEIDRIEACYDPGRGEASRRRKPEPGMLLDAAAALGIDLARSWMVGDRWKDVESGRRAGVRTILIDYGYDESGGLPPDHKVTTFPEAAGLILSLAAAG